MSAAPAITPSPTVPSESLPSGSDAGFASPSADLDFRLDISFAVAGPVIPEPLRITSDRCLQTCQTACTSCKTDGADED